MRLVTYRRRGHEGIGAVVNGHVLDLNAGFSLISENGVLARDMLHLLQQGKEGMRLAMQVVQAYQRLSTAQRMTLAFPLTEIEHLPPVPNPQKILAIGVNYRAHCDETGAAPPLKPLVFVKVPSALVGHEASIVYPRITQELDYEGELALVIGKHARNVPESEAMDYVAGYTIMNDVTARDLQRSEGQWARAKGCDTFAPCGPCLVTADEIADPHALQIETRINGEVRQQSSTADMIFRIPAIIAHISAAMTLVPGDTITTGTPAGVGAYRKPKGLLRPGDVVEIRIDGIGELRNPVVVDR